MKVQKQILHNCLDKAKSFYKLGDKDKARDYCDMGIAWVARFWMFLENKNLML